MHIWMLFFIAILNIGTLKTETIDFARKNNRMDVIFPLSRGKAKDEILHPVDKHVEDENKLREWNDADIRFQPNDAISRKIANFYYNDDYEGEDSEFSDQIKAVDQLDEDQYVRLVNYLIQYLRNSEPLEAPLILLKEPQDNLEDKPLPTELDGQLGVVKRSRYYRRYPWKRQNSRQYSNMDYDPYNACNPTKHDVFQLLVALHDARQGNKSRIVNFCNRKRPASAVYTNIRFLGKK